MFQLFHYKNVIVLFMPANAFNSVQAGTIIRLEIMESS